MNHQYRRTQYQLDSCGVCHGSGKLIEQPLSPQALYALAKATPNEIVVTREIVCPVCKGSGIRLGP